MPLKLRGVVVGCAVVGAALSGVSAARAQQVIYVRQSAPAGGNGQSWATAYNTIDPAVAAANQSQNSAGVEIWVAAGQYVAQTAANPLDPRTKMFVLRNTVPVSILGGFSGTEQSRAEANPAQNVAQIRPDLQNAYRAFWIASAAGVTVDGVTISGGRADGAGTTGDPADYNAPEGGAVFVDYSSTLLLRRVVCLGNQAGSAAALYSIGERAGVASHVTVERCRFISNLTLGGNERSAVVFGNLTDLQVSNCLFTNNSSANVILFRSPSSVLGNWTPRALNCTVANNTVSTGVIEVAFSDVNVEVSNCILWGNGVAPAGAQTGGNGALTFFSCVCDTNTGPFPAFQLSTADPSFVAPQNGDFRIGPASSALDTGDNSRRPVVPLDALDNFRLVDGDGNGTVAVDRGAFEYGSYPASSRLFVREGGSSTGPGLNWTTAFGSLQAALGLASQSSGFFTEVWVAAGTYRPASFNGPRSSTFALQSNLAIYGGFNGTETQRSQRNADSFLTVLSGDLNGDDNGELNRAENCYHVVTSSASGAVLDGCSIVGGNASGDLSTSDGYGGGILALGGQLGVSGCRFSSASLANSAKAGGAVAVRQAAQLTVSDCSFVHNMAGEDGGGGGAIYSDASARARVVRCQFTENWVVPLGHGGAIWTKNGSSWPSPITVSRCTFTRNGAVSAYGAGISTGAAEAWVENCRFLGNAGTAVSGGAVTVLNSQFVGNTAPYGGAIAVPDLATATVTQCTLVANTSTATDAVFGGGGGGIFARSRDDLAPCTLTVRNTILWQNTYINNAGEIGQIFTRNAAADLGHTTLGGWTGSYGGAGNNGTDPHFLRTPAPGPDLVWGTSDDDYGDLRIALDSPAIDSGDTFALPPDMQDLDGDANITESLPIDLAGGVRVFDYAGVSNTGVGTPPVDRGCYEFTPPDTSVPGIRRWVSPSGGAFAQVANWFPGAPTPADDALFELSAAYTVSFAPGAAASAQTLTVRNGAVTLNLPSAASWGLTSGLDASVVVGDRAGVPASLTVQGGRLNAVESRIGSSTGSVGTVNLAGAGALMASTQGLCIGCEGAGTLNITGGARGSCLFGFIGEQSGATGRIAVSGLGSRFDAPFFLAINDGELNVSSGGLAATGAFGAIYVFPDGRITGDGTVQGHVVNFGSVAPGNSPGTLTINGAYDQVGTLEDLGTVSGSLAVQVGGADPGQFDRLTVTGPVTLGGGLFVSLINGYDPPLTGFNPKLIDIPGVRTGSFDVAFFPGISGNRFLKVTGGPRDGSIYLATGSLGSGINYGSQATSTTTTAPTSAAVGRLNGDAFPDLALTLPDSGPGTGSVIILLNGGVTGGTWNNWQTGPGQVVQVFIGHDPHGIAIGDLNGDGVMDMVAANTADNTVSVLVGNGNGTFAVRPPIAVGTSVPGYDARPVSVAIANTGITGRNDILVACSGLVPGRTASSIVTILENHGDLAFEPCDVPVGPSPTSVEPTTINSAGMFAFVTSNAGNNTCTLVAPGSGARTTQNVGASPRQVISGDLNGDGLPELVTINDGDTDNAPSVSVLVSRGGGEFAPQVQSAVQHPLSMTALDLDQDGDRDLAFVTTSPTQPLQALRNDLSGGQLAFAPVTAPVPQGIPALVVRGDVENDGQEDLIVVGREGGRTLGGLISVVPNRGGAVCYPNCDQSTTPPILNVADFTCFLQQYSSGSSYANCDRSTTPPVLNVADFTCFLQGYAAGCR